jgi:hypothetical protein
MDFDYSRYFTVEVMKMTTTVTSTSTEVQLSPIDTISCENSRLYQAIPENIKANHRECFDFS